MEQRTCRECSDPFAPARAIQVYCSRRCRIRRKEREKYRRKVGMSSHRNCGFCGSSFENAYGRKYCSEDCIRNAQNERLRAQYEQLRNDPKAWAAYLAELRANYVPKPPRETRFCSVTDCGRKHCARGFCAKHYYGSRRASGETDGHGRKPIDPPLLMPALVKRYDESGEFIEEPWSTKIVMTVHSGLLSVRCPNCHTAPIRMLNYSYEFWDCAFCWTRVRMNKEEVLWAISEQPLTVP